MPRAFRFILVFACVTSFACDRAYDASRVDRSLAELRRPYRRVDASVFTDGGSVGISIVDAAGRSRFFFVAARIEDAEPYARIFVGGIPEEGRDVPELVDPEPTKLMLVRVLRAKNGRSHEEDMALAALSGRALDSARAVIHGLVNPD